MATMAATFEFWSLAITRLVGLVGVIYSLEVLRRLCASQAAKGHREIPRPVILFAIGWLVILFVIFSYLLVVGSDPITAGWFRAIYGMALIWAFVGMAWIVSLGQTAWRRRDAEHEREVVDRIVQTYTEALRDQRGANE